MKKPFSNWHKKKENIDNRGKRVYFHEREVWWCRIGVNVGYEQDGKGENFARPVIIFRKFNNEVCWIVPLSAKIKSGKFYLPIDLNDGMARVAILSQLRLIDAKRLYQKIGVLDKDEMEKLRNMIIDLCKAKQRK